MNKLNRDFVSDILMKNPDAVHDILMKNKNCDVFGIVLKMYKEMGLSTSFVAKARTNLPDNYFKDLRKSCNTVLDDLKQEDKEFAPMLVHLLVMDEDEIQRFNNGLSCREQFDSWCFTSTTLMTLNAFNRIALLRWLLAFVDEFAYTDNEDIADRAALLIMLLVVPKGELLAFEQNHNNPKVGCFRFVKNTML